ncbi:DUF1810 domain-containing protein [Sphingomonas donggukensis]|uniref:DUF1810 domain-containing protein n=1 Tax=Sphingomonas donggukensis TaxID=2949093 RepID=A0ABY4TY22_9SPHN|nr:DUF1810 domain-containing protein [Sphingomonas donggukensis]URW75441.1 DUF1810 domain-containing protein [Sphingomonas donggukensis]
MTDPLDRFVAAQAHGVHAAALAELRAGHKRTHWMWFVFPQVAGLGRSATAIHYALADVDAARAYLAHPILGPRLHEAAGAILAHANQRTADQILGPIDAIKLRSSATLFDAAVGDPVFAAILDAFYAGARDPATLDRMHGA